MNKKKTSNAGSAGVPRQDHEFPDATAKLGWRFHHVGIPTREIRPDEVHIPHLGMHVSAFESSPCGIQWMRFDADSPVSELVRRVAHVAFVVDNLEEALAGRTQIGEINSPSPGVRVAMIIDHGAPVELMEFDSRES